MPAAKVPRGLLLLLIVFGMAPAFSDDPPPGVRGPLPPADEERIKQAGEKIRNLFEAAEFEQELQARRDGLALARELEHGDGWRAKWQLAYLRSVERILELDEADRKRVRLARLLFTRAEDLLFKRGEVKACLPLYREVADTYAEVLGGDDIATAEARWRLGMALERAREPVAALPLLREAARRYAELCGAEGAAHMQNEITSVLHSLGDHEAAYESAVRTAELVAAAWGPDYPLYGLARYNVAAHANETGRHLTAAEAVAFAEQRIAKLGEGQAIHRARCPLLVARAFAGLGKDEVAVSELQRGIELVAALRPEQGRRIFFYVDEAATACRGALDRTGKTAEVAAAIEALRRNAPSDPL